MNTLSELVLSTDGCIFFSNLSSPLIDLRSNIEIKKRGTIKYNNNFGDIPTVVTLSRGVADSSAYDYPFLSESDIPNVKSCEFVFEMQPDSDTIYNSPYEFMGLLSTNVTVGSFRALFLIFQTGELGWFLNQAGQNNVLSTQNSRSNLDGSRHHAVLQFDGSHTHVFIDGKEDESLLIPFNFFSMGQSGVMTLLGFPHFDDIPPYGGGASGTHFALYDRTLDQSEITQRASLTYSLFRELETKLIGEPILWANKKTREEANPQPSKLQVLGQKTDAKLIGKSGNYSSLLDNNGNQRQIGYYQSTVLIDNIPSSQKKVLCFTNSGHLVAETISNSEGEYRFDYLDLNKKYMFVAQYSNEVNTPPDYAAVAADWQTPTPYKE